MHDSIPRKKIKPIEAGDFYCGAGANGEGVDQIAVGGQMREAIGAERRKLMWRVVKNCQELKSPLDGITGKDRNIVRFTIESMVRGVLMSKPEVQTDIMLTGVSHTGKTSDGS